LLLLAHLIYALPLRYFNLNSSVNLNVILAGFVNLAILTRFKFLSNTYANENVSFRARTIKPPFYADVNALKTSALSYEKPGISGNCEEAVPILIREN